MSHFNGPWKPALVLAFLFALCCIDIGRDLWTPDEPREAEISREMQLRPSVIPTLNDERFIEKPPLYYWLVAVAFELTGGPSVIGARAVGVLASWLTLLTVFLWGRREFSETTGLLAAFGLATSTQFLISSHWVLMDPLLMLAMTLAAWLAWKVIAGRDRTRSVLGFYLLLAVALWIKGLIGPVLLASGLLAYAATTRSMSPIRALRPVLGFFLLLAATAVLAGLIGAEGGRSAVREWLWVNHVQRFIDPQGTGHDQPFYYYLVAVPLAVFPWWVPVADCFRPSSWVASSDRGIALRRYLAALAVRLSGWIHGTGCRKP